MPYSFRFPLPPFSIGVLLCSPLSHPVSPAPLVYSLIPPITPLASVSLTHLLPLWLHTAATYCRYILPLHTATPACRLVLLPCSSYYAVFHTFFGSRSCSPGNCHGVLLLACRIPPRYKYLFGPLYLNSLYITVSLVSTIYLDSSVNDCCHLFIHLT